MSGTPAPGSLAAQDRADELGPPRQRRVQRIARVVMQVLWPAFLMAIIAEGIVFSMVDPHELRFVSAYLQDSRVAAYTVSFFVFWALFACSSGVTYFLAHGIGEAPPHDDA